MNIENVSRYGRSFSIVRVPYCFKLLMQELQTMNIQMRIITEKNIDQLESLSYSNNINKLFYDNDIQPNDIINANKEILQNNNDGTITVSSVKRDYTNVATPSNIQEENIPIQDVRQIADDPFLPSQDVDPFDDKPVQTIESDDPFADVIQEVSLSDFGKNNPSVSPQYPATSPQYPAVTTISCCFTTIFCCFTTISCCFTAISCCFTTISCYVTRRYRYYTNKTTRNR